MKPKPKPKPIRRDRRIGSRQRHYLAAAERAGTHVRVQPPDAQPTDTPHHTDQHRTDAHGTDAHRTADEQRTATMNALHQRGMLCMLLFMTSDLSNYRSKSWRFCVTCLTPRTERWQVLTRHLTGINRHTDYDL